MALMAHNQVWQEAQRHPCLEMADKFLRPAAGVTRYVR
jgi:hypothetical protein